MNPVAADKILDMSKPRLANADVGLALFVKTPGLSPIKTRLAAGVGTAAALRLYRASLRAVEAALRAARRACPGLQPYYAVAESGALAHPRWRGLPRIAQGEGDLGARLARVHGQLRRRHRCSMLLGADLPWLQAEHLLAATRALDDSDMAIGPGDDGGYYLFASRSALPDEVFTGVSYSEPSTLAQFSRLLAAHGSLCQLAALTDLDRAEEIDGLISAAPLYPNRPQRRLLRLLRQHRRATPT